MSRAARVRASSRAVLADLKRKVFENLYQNHLDGPFTCHVLVQIFRFVIFVFLKSAKFACNRSTCVVPPKRLQPTRAYIKCWMLTKNTQEGFRERRRCSKDTHPESYIAEYTRVYEDKRQQLVTFISAYPVLCVVERYRGTSLSRNSADPGPCSRAMPRLL